jgi:large subunit ribosomal protein L4
MERPVRSTEGKELRTIELDDRVFGREVSEGSIYHAIRNELANARVGTAKVKTRAEVRGGGKKPWRQKGTGRARAGTRRSPIWVGGGTIFGPAPRDYSYKLPKKQKRAATLSVLSKKVQSEELTVVEDFEVETGKTRDLVRVLSALVPEERTVLVMPNDDPMVKRAARNVPWLSYLAYNRLNVHDLFYAKHVVVMESAAKQLNEFYGATVT